MSESKRLLVVEVGPELFARVAPVLKRGTFDVDRFPGASGALELLAALPFDALVLGYPMSEVPIGDFLTKVRDGASAKASIVVLTSQTQRGEATQLMDRGVDLVVTPEDALEETERVMCALFGVAPRAALRVLVKLDLTLERGRDLFVAQTENISTSGMFVATHRRYPVGTDTRFELALPGEQPPVRGYAQVARHSERGDRHQGMGLRYERFQSEGDLERLCDYLARTI